ncbi:MAG: group 1 truncated hemoglobin [Myxococcales bacterium]|nr:MAG: group 1 truncated hemoglobin [Myxococcales bacterium]
MSQQLPNFFEGIGGKAKLKSIISDFVQRLFSDPMIGFFFSSISKERLTRFEYEHAAQWLGGPVSYSGRPLTQAHASHRIMGGQFDRRKMILKKTLEQHNVPQNIIDAWLEHTESLRSEITKDNPGECR